MDETRDPAGRVCIVCGRLLNYQEGVGWIHPYTDEIEDHPVIAVLPEEAGEQARPRCDFCFSDDVEWIIPARDFTAIPDRAASMGDWAACDPCKRLIESNRWSSLVERTVASYQARHPDHPVDVTMISIRRLYRMVRKNITGAPRRRER